MKRHGLVYTSESCMRKPRSDLGPTGHCPQFILGKNEEREACASHFAALQPKYEGFCILACARFPNPRRSMAFSVLKDSPMRILGFPFLVFPTTS